MPRTKSPAASSPTIKTSLHGLEFTLPRHVPEHNMLELVTHCHLTL